MCIYMCMYLANESIDVDKNFCVLFRFEIKTKSSVLKVNIIGWCANECALKLDCFESPKAGWMSNA